MDSSKDRKLTKLHMLTDDETKDPLLPLLAAGYAPEPTPGDMAMCGLYALNQAINNAEDLINRTDPARRCTFELLGSLFKSDHYRRLVAEALAVLPWDALDETLAEESQEYLQENWFEYFSARSVVAGRQP